MANTKEPKMATTQTTSTDKKDKNKNPATAATPTPATPATPATTATTDTPKKKKSRGRKQRVRFVSKTVPGFVAYMLRPVFEKVGAPYDSNGDQMVEQKAPAGGVRDPNAPSRKEAKAAEKAKLAAMSEEEKLNYMREKREAKAADKAKRAAEEQEKLIARIKADIAAGRL